MGLKSNDSPIDFSLKNHSNISPTLPPPPRGWGKVFNPLFLFLTTQKFLY